jgi:hypothetical protein
VPDAAPVRPRPAEVAVKPAPPPAKVPEVKAEPVAAPVVAGPQPAWRPVNGPKLARRRAERRAWRHRLYSESYDRVGRKSPRWDGLARKILRYAEDQTDRSAVGGDRDAMIRRAARGSPTLLS